MLQPCFASTRPVKFPKIQNFPFGQLGRFNNPTKHWGAHHLPKSLRAPEKLSPLTDQSFENPGISRKFLGKQTH